MADEPPTKKKRAAPRVSCSSQWSVCAAMVAVLMQHWPKDDVARLVDECSNEPVKSRVEAKVGKGSHAKSAVWAEIASRLMAHSPRIEPDYKITGTTCESKWKALKKQVKVLHRP